MNLQYQQKNKNCSLVIILFSQKTFSWNSIFLLLSILVINCFYHETVFANTAVYSSVELKSQIEKARDTGAPVTLSVGTYLLENSVSIDTFDKNISIIIPDGTIIIGGIKDVSELRTPMISFRGTTLSSTVSIRGHGTIKCGNCFNGFTSSGATQGASGIEAINLFRLEVSGLKFLAGIDQDGNGDSAITTVNVKTMRIKFNDFVGWDDVGIYISGNQFETGNDLNQWAFVFGNRFTHNHVAISSKRHYRYVRIENNLLLENFVDIGNFPVSTALGAGKELYIVNNSFYYTKRNVIDARGRYRSIRFNRNTICSSYEKGKNPGATLIHNSFAGQTSIGKILSKNNRIDTRFLNNTPIYKGENISHSDVIFGGC